MVFGDFTSLDKLVINLSSIFIALAASALLLYLAAWGSKFINLTISTVMSRLVGILLAAIAIQIILNGLNNWASFQSELLMSLTEISFKKLD